MVPSIENQRTHSALLEPMGKYANTFDSKLEVIRRTRSYNTNETASEKLRHSGDIRVVNTNCCRDIIIRRNRLIVSSRLLGKIPLLDYATSKRITGEENRSTHNKHRNDFRPEKNYRPTQTLSDGDVNPSLFLLPRSGACLAYR